MVRTRKLDTTKPMALALLLLLGMAPSVLAQEPTLPGFWWSPEFSDVPATARGQQDIAPSSESEGDAPALLDDLSVEGVADLARQLSARHDWLTPEVLATLRHSALRIDEIFASTPAYLAVEGQAFQIRVEPLGPRGQDLDPRTDSWFVFLTPEVYEALGEDRFLAFREGVQTVLGPADLESLPALGLTLAGLAETDRPLPGEVVASVDSRFDLAGPGFEPRRADRMLAAGGAVGLKNACAEVAPASCSNGQPVCGLAGYSPYFVLDSVLIKVKHEARGQSPEIELYPLQPTSSSALGPGIETQVIFDGRFARDLAGRWRYLPDINTTHTYHSISNGFALFPTDVASQWAALLVEDDKSTGKLDVTETVQTVVKLFSTASSFVKSVKTMNYFKLLKASYDLVRLVLDSNGDDCFDETLAFDRSLFCAEGLGQPFPTVLTFDTDEWAFQGHFACIETSCVPPPPLEASISGPSALDPWEIGTYTCTASHGDPPYTYTWHKGYGTTGPVVGTSTTSATSHNISLADTIDFQVTCALTDDAGASDSAVKGVVVEVNSGGCDPVQCNALCGGLGECTPNDLCECI